MRRTIVLSIAALGFLFAGPLFSQRAAVRATIPFSFYVGNSKLMPSGTYEVAPCAAHVVMVRHCEEGVAVMHLTIPSGEPVKEEGKLIFHKYGDTYFLNEVKGANLSSSLVLPVSKNEKKVQEGEATVRTFESITVPKPPETEQPQ